MGVGKSANRCVRSDSAVALEVHFDIRMWLRIYRVNPLLTRRTTDALVIMESVTT